jgi:hypothetical protein
MSQQGINRAAGLMFALQTARLELISLGSKAAGRPEGQQDILLGQMLKKAEDAIKDDFARIVAQKDT